MLVIGEFRSVPWLAVEPAGPCRLSARDFFPHKVIMKILSTIAVMSLAMAVTQAMAQSGPRMLVSNVEPAAQAGTMLVEVTVLNPGPAPKQNDLPDRIPAALTVDNRSTSVMLERAIPSPKQTIQPGGFEQAKYLLRLPAESRVRDAMILSQNGSASCRARVCPYV